MTKLTGLDARLLVAGSNVSGDIATIDGGSGGPALIDVTGLDVQAPERIGGLRDGQLDLTAHFNPAAGRAHEVFSALPTADTIVSYLANTTQGAPVASINAKQVGYNPNRQPNGAFSMSLSMLANQYGLEWGRLLSDGLETDSAAANGASWDDTEVSTDFGLQMYVHLLAFTGTSVTFTIEDSADDAAFATVTGAATSALTAAGAERVQTGRTENVRRYLRVVTSGTFTNAQFAVMFNRNRATTEF